MIAQESTQKEKTMPTLKNEKSARVKSISPGLDFISEQVAKKPSAKKAKFPVKGQEFFKKKALKVRGN